MDQSFPKARHVRKNPEFLRIYSSGRRVHSPHLNLVSLVRPGSSVTRLGLSVSRKVGDAVVRNRVKRRLREAFRLNLHHLRQGVDLVLVARPSAAGQGYRDLESAFLDLCRRGGLVREG